MKFISNLNGTILCPYQILLDLIEQIPANTPKIKSLAFAPICDLNSTNDWINLESLGKPVAIRAKVIADRVSALLHEQKPTQLALDIYCSTAFSSDNVYSLLFLAQRFTALELTFITPDAPEALFLEHIAPLQQQSNIHIHFKTDAALPQLASELAELRQKTIYGLGFSLTEDFLSTTQFSDSILNQLIGFSWMCLKSGGYDVACTLLQKAYSHRGINVKTQEQLFMHLLMMRFFSHQYALIAESDFPEQFHTLEASEVKTLQFLTAYSATLSRKLDIANKFFTRCGIHAEMPLSDETSLYQLNLFALSRVLQGEIDTAFTLEFRIKEFIAANKIDVVGLNYVNFINIARLYKKTQDFEQSLNYYNKAYEQISGGAYTTSDHIYYNMNLGSLHEAAGNNELALQYWAKAALHWLACDNKFVLSWRPRLILCGEKITDITKPLAIDKANEFLHHKLLELIQTCALDLSTTTPQAWHYVEDRLNLEKETCFINGHIVLYTGKNNSAAVTSEPTAAEMELAQLLSQYLQTVFDITPHQNTLILDTHLDTAALQSQDEAVAYASISHCSCCSFNGQRVQLEPAHSHKSLRISLSRAINAIVPTDNGLAIHYKRSFLNKTLVDQAEVDFVAQLNTTPSMELETTSAMMKSMVHQLVQKRVLNLSYAD